MGEPDTVIVVHSPKGGRKERYHTDTDCRFLEGRTTREWARDDAEDWGMTECGFCAGSVANDEQDHSTFAAALEYGKQQGGGSA